MKWYWKPGLSVMLLLTIFVISVGMLAASSGCAPYAFAAEASVYAQASSVPAAADGTDGTNGTDGTIPAIAAPQTSQQPAEGKKPAATIVAETAGTTAAAVKEMKSDAGKVLRVHFIDVGQADSAFIELPDGKTMLIDAGNAGDGPAVVQYIQNLGYSTIDYVVCSHPHEDHIGGMADVINNFTIGEIFMPKVAATTQTFEDLLSTIQRKGYTITTAQAGVEIAPGISILSPAAGSDYGSELNDWSAVISVCYGSRTFLFLGDAGTSPESTLSIDADVVKVSHHGSRTAYSKSFYEELSPEIAVISVGQSNTYGLPDEEVLQGLKSTGAVIYRTDENKTIVVESDGTGITVKAGVIPSASVIPAASSAAGTDAAAAAEISAATAAAAEPASGGVTVYKTKTGSKYHQAGCSYLKDSSIPISLEDAKAEGLTPCSRCDPPE